MRALSVSQDQPPRIVRLSAFLSGCHSTELQLFFESYESALATVLHAVPIRRETFKVMVTNYSGFTREFVMQEEAILDTPEARSWRDKRGRENRAIIMNNTDERDATADILSDTTGEFERKALTRRLQILYRDARLQRLDSLHLPRNGPPKLRQTFNKFTVLKAPETRVAGSERMDQDDADDLMTLLDLMGQEAATDQ